MRQMILDSSDSISQIMSRLQRLRVSTISMSISMHVVRGLAILIFFLNSRGHVNAYLGVGYKLKKMTRQVIPLPPTPYHAPMISLLLSGPAMFKFACACASGVCACGVHVHLDTGDEGPAGHAQSAQELTDTATARRRNHTYARMRAHRYRA